MKLRQDGGSHFAFSSGGPWILTQPPTAPALFVWLITQSGANTQAFTNFWNPVVPTSRPGTEPAAYSCTFDPEAALRGVEPGRRVR